MRVQAFRQTITAAWPRKQEEQAKAFLIKVATEGTQKIVAEQTARAGVPPQAQAFANRAGNENLATVDLPGPIVSVFDYRREVAAVALVELVKASPVESGAYRDSHQLYLNGSPVTGDLPVLRPGDEVMIANGVAYARRLEIGRTTSGRRFTRFVDNRIYENVARRLLRPLYGAVADIEFTYVILPDAYVTQAKLPSHYATTKIRRYTTANGIAGQRVLRKRRQIKAAVRAPAIVIKAHK